MQTVGEALNDKEIKDICIKGLVSFTDLCKKHDIRYFLAFGTLLGAVRHQGFIPWDDDIDLLIPRDDYNKLMKIVSEYDTEEWELLSYSTNRDFLFPYMKYCHKKTCVMPSRFNTGLIYGLSIDIFPLDFFDRDDENSLYQELLEIKTELINLEKSSYKANVLTDGTVSALKRYLKKFLYHLNKKKIKMLLNRYAELDSMLSKESLVGGKYAAYMYNRYCTIWEREDFLSEKNGRTLEFEGRFFSVPNRYESVLRKTYGNYMVLPPVEKQVTIHTYRAYYRA